ncbi:MAG: hypothetical protein U9O94_09575 [Nanoarchaeota archaeon]|nr:hypothetical protein [Nanoarchaeota archaeon]
MFFDGWEYSTHGFKMGGYFGDHTSTACDSKTNPGTAIGKYVLIAGPVPKWVPKGHFVKGNNIIPRRPETNQTLEDRANSL